MGEITKPTEAVSPPVLELSPAPGFTLNSPGAIAEWRKTLMEQITTSEGPVTLNLSKLNAIPNIHGEIVALIIEAYKFMRNNNRTLQLIYPEDPVLQQFFGVSGFGRYFPKQ